MTQPTQARGSVTLRLERGSRSLRVWMDAIGELHARTAGATAESGGLLLGAMSEGEIAVERVREVHRDEREGPFVFVSERERLEAKRLAGESAALAVVGFYRSHLRSGELLQKEDIESAGMLGNVALIAIVQPESATRSVGHMFIRGLHGVWVRAGAFSLPDLEPVEQPLPPPDPEPQAIVVAPLARLKMPRFSAWWALPAVPVVVALLTWLAFRSPRPAAPPPASSGTAARGATDAGLEMRLERSAGGDMKIQWNRQAPAVQSAVGGWLRIREGETERELDLDIDQLRSGNLLYAGGPGTDVVFRLEVFDTSGRVTSESVRLIGGLSVRAPRPAMQVRAPVRQQGLAGRGQPAPVVQPLRRLEMPQSKAPRSQPALPSPDEVAGGPQLAPPPFARTPAAPAPAPSAPAVNQPPQAAPDRLEPARATRQFRPVVPSNVKAMLTEDTSVTVMVTVNEQGKVVGAAPQTTTGPAGQMLAGVAVDAARAWRFEPARRNGRAVPSNVSLVFHFAR